MTAYSVWFHEAFRHHKHEISDPACPRIPNPEPTRHEPGTSNPQLTVAPARPLHFSPPLPLFPNLWFDLSCVPVPWTSCCRREAQTRTSTCSSRVQRSLSRVQRPSSTGGSRRRGRYSCSEHHSGSFFSYCTAPTLFEYLDNVQMDRHRVRVSKPYCNFFFLSFVAL